MKISIIIPCLNEEESILQTLMPLQTMREHGHEVIISDGGSTDKTCELALPYVDTLITSPKGRAQQMNTGALQANGDVFWFLHADTIAPENADQYINQVIKYNHSIWGRFNVHLSGQKFQFRIIEFLMNLRSCLTGIATGDQGIFVLRSYFKELNGYKNISLMEDVEISKRLKKIKKPACIKHKITTSSRRWEKHGILRTIFLMWKLRTAYYLGASEDKLASQYKHV
ncbi:MAG: TIGR04283 family arsenosugar biosynthesis glycosyltransferase [Gammaproteobacteria bacterium]|nr:TIGR04283 family arsenosugar biosynthesis glycosyltransferase [Gammaproteobacteria bacterium]MCW8911519.1 TIGR04283 family arsenosugar biosynthesis glycosyltransferase [Gammaproteobacteria bacterium]MCW9004447.1 TIGR04283 family arsenosugar biosynthesis glycosyltransferase [Gammaproteobacteria bacterium]